MIQPTTWKAIGEYLGRAWGALGPLVGVLVGAWLARSGDRKKWMDDNRKEECRELLGAVSENATMLLSERMHSQNEKYAAFLRTMTVFQTLIFIAEEVEKADLMAQWAHAVNDFGKDADPGKIDAALEKIRKAVIGIAGRD